MCCVCSVCGAALSPVKVYAIIRASQYILPKKMLLAREAVCHAICICFANAWGEADLHTLTCRSVTFSTKKTNWELANIDGVLTNIT